MYDMAYPPRGCPMLASPSPRRNGRRGPRRSRDTTTTSAQVDQQLIPIRLSIVTSYRPDVLAHLKESFHYWPNDRDKGSICCGDCSSVTRVRILERYRPSGCDTMGHCLIGLAPDSRPQPWGLNA